MPLLGTRGAASAKGFGFTVGGATAPDPWTYTQTNQSVGSATVNYGKNFGSNSVPKGTLIQYNGIQSVNTSSLGIWIPQAANWKPFNLNYFVIGSAQPSLNSNGWTGNLSPGYYPGNNTSCFDALLNTKDIQYGSYVGDGTSSRTIPHSLQAFPGVVFCMRDGGYTGGFRYDRPNNQAVVFAGSSSGSSFFNDSTASLSAAISSWSTASTFRVPDPCNTAGVTYYYLAIANSGTTVYCGTYNGISTQNIGFQPGTIITKGSSGGNYAWHNPYPITANANQSDYYYNSFWTEAGALGYASSSDAWNMSSTGFTSPNNTNSWYGTGAGDVYYWAIKKTS